VRCLKDLREIGFQVGCGMMVGSPYQTVDYLLDDLYFMAEFQPHMIGIGRYLKGEKLLAVFNFSDSTETAWIRDATVFTDLLTGQKRDAGAVTLGAKDFIWLLQTY
jgi:hypothetical protein